MTKVAAQMSGGHPLDIRSLLLTSTILYSGLALPALAQTPGSIAPPPVRQSIDENGVDVVRGTYNIAQTDVSIGGAGRHGLSFRRFSTGAAENNTLIGSITASGGRTIVTVDGVSDSFTGTGSFTPTEANGASLVLVSGIYTYTSRDGTVARFASNSGYFQTFYDASLARLASVTYPDGTRIATSYRVQDYCPGGYESGICNSQLFNIARVQSVTNNNGYQLKLVYANNATKVDDVNFDAWSRITSVKALNNAVEYCDPVAVTCTFANAWPTASYARSEASGVVTSTVTDAAGRVTRYTSSSGTSLRIKRPGAAADNIIVTYGANGVASVVRDGVTHSYSYADNGNTRTTTVTNPNNRQRIYVSDRTTSLISSFRNELVQTETYTYDANGRILQARQPEGNYVRYAYDARGNATTTSLVPKSGSGQEVMPYEAAYESTCTNPKTCNQLTSITDPYGNVTDYAYDPTHGGLLSVTLALSTVGGIRPQTRYGYTPLQAYYKNSTGAIVASGFPIYELATVSACQTLASCSGTDQVRTTIGYGPQSASTANNLLPVSSATGSSDGALTATTLATYDTIGNRLTVDGPLAADTTGTTYDLARQVTGVTGPDPDGAGPLSARTQRLTYNLDGQVTLMARGTAAQPTLMAMASTFDANARKIRDEASAGGAVYGVTQYSYDNLGRLDCTAVRMNPGAFAASISACSPGAEGGFGPDRISRTVYNGLDRPLQLVTGVGTALQRAEATATYTPNAQVQTLADAKGNLTTYAYDGHDRLRQTYYPSATNGTVSSTTDFEQLTYNTPGLLSQRRLRDGTTVGYVYDSIGRLIRQALPGLTPDDQTINYTNDNLGRLVLASKNPQNQTRLSYDALGRKLTESNYYYAMSFQ